MSRQDQLEKLIAARARGKTATFARMIDRSDAVVYQLRSGYRHLGDALARHIEIACALPQGWLDTDDDVPRRHASAAPYAPPLPLALPVVLDAIRSCPDSRREELRSLLTLLVDHDAPAYRQRLAELLGAAAPALPVESRDFQPPVPGKTKV
jgi:hypothetical protein